MSSLGYGEYIFVSALFATGGAIALWIDYGLRKWEERKRKNADDGFHSTAAFHLKNNDGQLTVDFLSEKSENVAHWVWYVNNGGTMRNEGVLFCIEFERPVIAPDVFGHAERARWRELSSTDRSIYVEFEGWPEGDIVIQAITSKALGIDRRREQMIWRDPGPLDP